jgi:hypothetical protein
VATIGIELIQRRDMARRTRKAVEPGVVGGRRTMDLSKRSHLPKEGMGLVHVPILDGG